MTQPGHRPSSMRTRATRGAAYFVYYLGAQHLPRSFAKGGTLGLRSRRWAAKHLFDDAGQAINVEHGASFGSGKGISIGDRSGIGIDADLHGLIEIGNDVMMGPRCTILTRNHRIDRTDIPMNAQGFDEYRPVVIEDDVWIGVNVTIMPGVRIGSGSVVAAGAVVTHDVPPLSIVGGVPARVIGSRTHRAEGRSQS